ncbi:hypothetical protein HGRIS_006427 [Hohenbuehelia grisea]|uniref:Uncharacterized protein n=1 Tax=Hohenbuehelia grisea TaxID=104357 RepID=A0ABR3K1N7_9AGAR
MIPARTLSTIVLAFIASHASAANIPQGGLEARQEAECQWFGTPPFCRYKECPSSHPKLVEKAWNKVGASPEHRKGFHTLPFGDGGCSSLGGQPQLYCCKERKYTTAPEAPKTDDVKWADTDASDWPTGPRPDAPKTDDAKWVDVNKSDWPQPPTNGWLQVTRDGRWSYQSCGNPYMTSSYVPYGGRAVEKC